MNTQCWDRHPVKIPIKRVDRRMPKKDYIKVKQNKTKQKLTAQIKS
jgi:hypothetical protein